MQISLVYNNSSNVNITSEITRCLTSFLNSSFLNLTILESEPAYVAPHILTLEPHPTTYVHEWTALGPIVHLDNVRKLYNV